MTHKFHVGQAVWLTGGANGDKRIPAEIIDHDSGGNLRVRVDEVYKWYLGKEWPAGDTRWLDGDGNGVLRGCPHIIPRETDFTDQWEQIKAFAKERGLEVPDLPEPEDADLVELREAFAAEYEKNGFELSAINYRDGTYDNRIEMRAALAYVKKVRAEYEGEG